MAAPRTIRGTQLLIAIGDGDSPEVFEHPCLINAERGISFTSDTNQEIVPDCDNPEDPGWKVVTKDGFSATITGSGMFNGDEIVVWDAWMRSDTAKNVRVYTGAGADEVGYWPGAFKLTQLDVNGERSRRATNSITLMSDGEVGAFVAT